MNKYLLFRTDRIGDFLTSAILIHSIKRNDPNAYIKVVASKNNFLYIKNCNLVNEVILFPNNFFLKIKFTLNLYRDTFFSIIVLDGKKRSIFSTFFLKSNKKILINAKKIYKIFFSIFFSKIVNKHEFISHFEEILEVLNFFNFNYSEFDLNILDNKVYSNLVSSKFSSFENKNYLVLHFDEKWFSDQYISSYVNINPSCDDLIFFIDNLLKISGKNLVVTTGTSSLKIVKQLIDHYNANKHVKIFDNLDFDILEYIIINCCTLITCHGAVSHIASAKNIKLIDILEEKNKHFYSRWTHHFRNYNYLFRKKFNLLAKEIINLL